MRILVALARDDDIDAAAAGLAALAADNELAIIHGGGDQVDPLASHLLGVALRNAMPGRDVVTVLNAVVVGPDEPASPEPTAVAELRSLRALLDGGALLICAGGGGIPVTLNGDGTMRPVEGEIDADLTAALLARRLDADLLLLLTDAATDEHAAALGPKAEAARRFADATGRRAAIGALADAERLVSGEAGAEV